MVRKRGAGAFTIRRLAQTSKIFAPYSSTIYRYSPPNSLNRPSILKVGQAGYPLGPPATEPSSDTRATDMSTHSQIEANRRNAQKSTGPTSVTGKAAPIPTPPVAPDPPALQPPTLPPSPKATSPQIGFVPSNPIPAPPQPAPAPPPPPPSPKAPSPKIGFFPPTPFPPPPQPAPAAPNPGGPAP